jgi:hypothetical protein
VQDWHYMNTGTMDLTIEVDDTKWPKDEKIQLIVDEHVEASLELCSKALFGSVRGFVRDETGLGIEGASVSVGDVGLPVLTDASGFFAKPSSPSNKKVTLRFVPPHPWLPRTHIIDNIDPINGATIDVTLYSSPIGIKFLVMPIRVVIIIVVITTLFWIRRITKRRRRISQLSESITNNPDVEKAVANRRGGVTSYLTQ